MDSVSTKQAPAYTSAPPDGIDVDEYVDTRAPCTSPEAAHELLRDEGLWPDDREACNVALLNTRHHLLSVEPVSLGSIDHTFMTPREIYRLALTVHPNCSAIVVAHNHPSGDPNPSDDDFAITNRLYRAGETLGVQLLDHIILGAPGCWTSLARKGAC